MEKHITFRHMAHSRPMEDYINKQIAKIEKFLQHEREPIFIELVLEPSKVHAHHQIELRIKTADYYLVNDYEGPDFYDVLDRVLDVMYDRLHEKKRQMVDEKKHGLTERK